MNEDQLIEALVGCQALLLGGDEYVSEKVMVNSPELKLISFVGVDYNWFVDTKAAENHGIKIVNTPGQLTDSVAEFCVAQLISSIAFDKFYDEGTAGASAIAEYSPERVIVTKHIASLTHVARNAMAIKAVENIVDFFINMSSSDDSYRSSLA